MALIRLDKLLSNRTPHSRSEIRDILKKGGVRVDGVVECKGDCKVDPDVQEITLGGKRLVGQTHVCVILNKPQGYICATEDRVHKVAAELLPAELRVKGIFPAGRLDADSTGLVLMTDDGDLAHRMLAPKSHVPKYYLVKLARPFRTEYIAQLAQGLTLSDGTQCLPAQVKALEGKKNYALICLHEGKYHQVKRMFAALGNHVENLHRVAVGGMILPETLASGACIEVLHKDVERLLKANDFESIYERIVTNFSSYLINAGQ